MMDDFENVVSVDELLDYFFDFGFKPEFQDDPTLSTGMASDEQVIEALRSFLKGWESPGDTNPPEDQIIPELLKRYRAKFNLNVQ